VDVMPFIDKCFHVSLIPGKSEPKNSISSQKK